MKSARPLLLAALLVCGLAPQMSAAQTGAAQPNTNQSNTNQPSTAQSVRLDDPALPFAVSLPRGWVGVTFKDGLAGLNIASAQRPPAALMRFTYIPKQGRSLDLASEFRAFETAVAQGGGTLRLLSTHVGRYGGVTGLSHTYDLMQAGQQLRMHIWFGNGRKNFYNFQFTDALSSYAARLPTFQAALSSVQFR